MAECEVLNTCPFFNDKMTEMPATANALKNRYCKGDNSKCARYMVLKALGKAKVPADLSPDKFEKAREIISAG